MLIASALLLLTFVKPLEDGEFTHMPVAARAYEPEGAQIDVVELAACGVLVL
jgi:hypothetical protein